MRLRESRIRTFYAIIDSLITALETHITAYQIITDKFGFLSQIDTIPADELIKAARHLVKCYPDDSEYELESELVHFASIIKGLLENGSI